MDNITGRTTARRSKRATKANRRETADLSQVLRMTPTRGSRETLATATALQRARAAALQKDHDAAIATPGQDKNLRARRIALEAIRASDFKFRSDPPVTWTPEDNVDTDADDENEEETYAEDENRRDDEQDAAAIAAAEDAETLAADEDAAAIAAAEDAAGSEVETPASERHPAATQSDLDFIATDEEKDEVYTDDPDYYPSTAEENEEEEEELWTSLLDSGRLSEPQSDRVRTRLRTMQRKRAIARTLFAMQQDKDKPEEEEQPASISPPVRDPPTRGSSPAPAVIEGPPTRQEVVNVDSKAITNENEDAAKNDPILQPTPSKAQREPSPTPEKNPSPIGIEESTSGEKASLPDSKQVQPPNHAPASPAPVPKMAEPRYVPVREYSQDPIGYERYAAWEKANKNDPRVRRRSIDPEPCFVAASDTDINRHGYNIYQQWSLRQPDIARDQHDQCHARPGDMPDESGFVPCYGMSA